MKRMTKWKKAVSVLLIVATMVLMVSGCGGKTATTENKGSSKYRVCMITDAGDITDQSFNQTTYEACRDYCAANDIDFTFKFIVLDMSASDIGAAAVGNAYYDNPDAYDVSDYTITHHGGYAFCWQWLEEQYLVQQSEHSKLI